MKNEFTFADSVWHRVVQIVQEAMLTGVDCADLLRQIRVCASSEDSATLELSPAYQKHVQETYEKLLDQARELQVQQPGNKFIIGGSGGSN